MFKTANLQNHKYTCMDDDINVTINSLNWYLGNLMNSVESQSMFKEATQIIYKISFCGWYTERRLISNLLVQHDMG